MRPIALLLFIPAFPFCGAAFAVQTEQEDFFEARIRPVLATSCFKCHGDKKAGNELRVDSRLSLLKGGKSGPAIVSGEPENSLLFQAISHSHDEFEMPPDQPLPKQVIADFAVWIKMGAAWPASITFGNSETHWAFQPIQNVKPPKSADTSSENAIDRFVARARVERNLQPVRPAEPIVLLRRLYFDLIGLPPTQDDVARFHNNFQHDAVTAFNFEMEHLLASPRYGERWGRYWMDVVRYADTAGDNADYPIPEARLYRDYIIDSFNNDLPFDQFLREQIAGDIIAKQLSQQSATNPRNDQQIIATGFLALSRRYGTAPYELWHLTLEDTVDTVGRAFMGLTLKCARCHDHKFDPVTTEDYYRLYGIFDSTRFPWAGGEEFQSKQLPRQGFVPLAATPEAEAVVAGFESTRALLQKAIAELEQQLSTADDPQKPELQKQLDEKKAELFNFQKRGLPSGLAGAYAVQEGAPHDVPIQIYGVPGTSQQVIPRGAIEFLCKAPLEISAQESGRVQLAQWLTAADHPLTARVIVNRIWQHHFGRGIVATPSNFGVSGIAPTHPELLDYLASRFVKDGWSIKSLHRLILSSHTWQLSSDADERSLESDPANDVYWRFNRRRLDAESIRDSLLSVSGQLNLSRPAEHPFPPINDWHWTQHNQFKECYESKHRSVYLMTQRIQKHPFLALFDGPDTNTTTDKRTSAIVTPQSLYLMNSQEMKQIATALADRLIRSSADTNQRVKLAFNLCFARDASVREVEKGANYINAFLQQLPIELESANQNELDAWLSYSRILLSSNEFMYID